ncbi:MAG: hypothetical protein IJV88_02535 [Ruminococcus sp.]|nr:hypothetical protein [Ruminococcus sp.]
MIKGINRQIIEVTDTGNTYYEKAWLVVRPEYTRIQSGILEKEARALLKNASSPSCMKPKRSAGFWLVRLGLSAIMGAGISTIFHLIFF